MDSQLDSAKVAIVKSLQPCRSNSTKQSLAIPASWGGFAPDIAYTTCPTKVGKRSNMVALCNQAHNQALISQCSFGPSICNKQSGFAFDFGSQSSQGGFAPSIGSQNSPDCFAPGICSQSTQDSFAASIGSQNSQAGFAPGLDSQRKQGGFAPSSGSQSNQGGFAPSTGSQSSKDGFAPSTGSQSSNGGFAPQTLCAALPISDLVGKFQAKANNLQKPNHSKTIQSKKAKNKALVDEMRRRKTL